MVNCKEINDYIDFVRNNPEKTCRWIKLLIENIIVPCIESEDSYFDEESFKKCLRFEESNFHEIIPEWIPQTKFKVACQFIYKDKNFNKLWFSTTFDLEGRGNAKTTGWMPFFAYCLTPLNGIKNYNVNIVANSENQGKEDFDIFKNILDGAKEKWKRLFGWTATIIRNIRTKSYMRYNTSNASTKDGAKGGVLYFDEVHEYKNYDQINVYTSQRGKVPKERDIYTTTQGYVRGGPLDDYVEVCIEILETGVNELGYLPILNMLDSEDEVDNPKYWCKANPLYDYSEILRDEIYKAWLDQKKFPHKRNNFIVKRMNLIKEQTTECAVAWDDILKTNQPIPYEELKNRDCLGCIDYASTNDFVGVGLLFKYNEKVVFMPYTFICAKSINLPGIKAKTPLDDWIKNGLCEVVHDVEVKPSIVADWFKEKATQYNIKRIVIDTYRFTLMSKALEEIGFESPTSMAERKAMERENRQIIDITIRKNIMYSESIINSYFLNGNVIVGDNPMFRWMINNTKRVPCSGGNYTYDKIEPKLRKNDTFMAFVHGMTRLNILDEAVASEWIDTDDTDIDSW